MSRVLPLIRPVPGSPARTSGARPIGTGRILALTGSLRRLPRTRVAFLAILAGALVLRVWGWPMLPAGLNQDEMSAGYEAWSLLQTGADRWGNAWPAYFVSWGSGQNVLYSYLTIPFIAVLGPTTVAVRAVSLLAGIASVVLGHRVAEDARRGAGLWTMLIIAVCPWQVMVSHWALESNLMPTMVLLGLFTIGRALRPGRRQAMWILVALLPLALALYAYGIFLVPCAALVALVAVRYHRPILRRWRLWLASAGVAGVLAAPFGLFVVTAYVVHRPLKIQQYLPFTVPQLAINRLDQVAEKAGGGPPLLPNLALVLNGFNDGEVWNTVLRWAPLSSLLVVVGLLELGLVVWTAARTRSLQPFTLVDLLLLSALPLLVLLQLNLNQSNVLAMALVLSAGKGLSRVPGLVAAPAGRRAATAVVAAVVVVPGLLAFAQYTGPAYAAVAAPAFTPGAEPAIRRAAALDPSAPLWITPTLSLNYVQTVWYLRVPPKDFQAAHASIGSPDFERYRFLPADTATMTRYAFVVESAEANPCATPTRVVDTGGFRSGWCSARS